MALPPPSEIVKTAVGLMQQNHLPQAETLLQDGLRQNPDDCILQHFLGELYRIIGQLQPALTLFSNNIARYPQYLPSFQSAALVLKRFLESGTLNDAQKQGCIEQLAMVLNNTGNIQLALRETSLAEMLYREALHYKPNYAKAMVNLSNACRDMGRVTEAEEHARAALALEPQLPDAWNHLGNALMEQGELAEAAAAYDRVLELEPEPEKKGLHSASSRLFMQLYRPELGTEELVAMHRDWGKTLPVPRTPYMPPAPTRYRIGFISSDFMEHVMIRFIQPMIEHLDRRKFEIFCYANQTVEDGASQAIKNSDLHWRNVRMLTDGQLAAQMKQDGLHALVDLNGHTHGNRLHALAQKPAPVMATWLGYMFTTGFEGFHYRITDEWTDPRETAPPLHSEQLLYLKQSQFIYRPKAGAPEVNALPATRNGYITFGSLNNLLKTNDAVIALWAAVLNAVPTSRLLLKTKQFADEAMKKRMHEKFAAYSIAAERIELRPASSDYMNAYHDIDIALDPFPYNGGATSCDALWMGVPVLTLAGDRSVGRMGVSVLTALGLKPWIAATTNEYTNLAMQFAADIATLTELRAGLRARFEQSALRDEKTFGVDFGDCLGRIIETPPP